MDDRAATKEDIRDLSLMVGELIRAIIGATTNDKEKLMGSLESAVKIQKQLTDRFHDG